MAIIMNKEMLIRVPEPLYKRLKEASANEYKSMSAFVRDAVKEKLDESLSVKDWEDIQMAREELKEGKSTSWRSIKNG